MVWVFIVLYFLGFYYVFRIWDDAHPFMGCSHRMRWLAIIWPVYVVFIACIDVVVSVVERKK